MTDEQLTLKLGNIEVKLPLVLWKYHSTFVEYKNSYIPITSQRTPKALSMIEQLLKILQLSTDRAEIASPLPSKTSLEMIYQWNDKPDTELIAFLTSTFPIPFSSEQNALICDTMDLCSELELFRALNVFASYFAFAIFMNERAQRLQQTQPSTSQTSQPPLTTTSSPAVPTPMDIVI